MFGGKAVRPYLALALVLAVGSPLPAGSGTAPVPHKIQVELSRLEPQAQSCRIYVLFENSTMVDFAALRLDLVMFDGGRGILSRIGVPMRSLPPGRMRVAAFDAPGVDCSDIGSFLLNGVLLCQEQTGRLRDDCETLLHLSSRTRVPFLH